MRLWRRRSRRERLVERVREALPEGVARLPEHAVEAASEGIERLRERAQESVPERVREALPEGAVQIIGRRKRRGRGWISLVLGLLAGAAAGGVVGLLLAPAPEGDGEGGLAERVQALPERARTAFERGRAQARQAGGAAAGGAAEARMTALSTAGDTAADVLTPVRSFGAALKERWREAVEAGKVASAEKQAELRRRYLEDTRRV
jgi:gas vesicle protein